MDDVYKEAIKRLENRFAKEVNLVMVTYKYYTQPQSEYESIDEFVARLRDLSIKCRFGNMTEELICDQLIVQCKEKKIQERLWAAKDPTLMEAIGMAKVIEESQRCMRELNRRDKTSDVSLVNADCQSGNESEVSVIRRKEKRKHVLPAPRNKGDCARCGSTYHDSDSKKCFAGNKICRRCGRKGHFARVCREASKANKNVNFKVGALSDTDKSMFADRVLMVTSDLKGTGEDVL
ncbi:hypothetical protein NDU88_006318 [Pleurodeles waltl]|uniref:CCHC-type domain-containing protein n=1 Tax=Pleurodeles waltl TaxID=8319 RepID=A0AAV7MD34_PLEWA|nr:hypothetical protein NDU88_006318 [Pleurodeles waltl]